MRFYWVRDRIGQDQFKVFWKPGSTNLGDYFTKHHNVQHHKCMHLVYLHCPGNAAHASVRVCYSKPTRGGNHPSKPEGKAQARMRTCHAGLQAGFNAGRKRDLGANGYSARTVPPKSGNSQARTTTAH